MLTLHAAKGTVAVATHIALEETGVPYTVIWVDFSKGEQQSPAYLAINPKGRVPALITEHGILTETPALLDYVAETTNQLMPKNTFDKARAREMIGYLAATAHVNHAHGKRGARWSDDAAAIETMRAKLPETMTQSCAYIEGRLPDNGWLVGDYSIADIHLFTLSRWLESDGVDLTNFPKLAAHRNAMQARPAVAQVVAAHG